MPTKTQAKTAVDSADVAIKADIDNVLPVGVNITGGTLFFNPTFWTINLTVPDLNTAQSQSSSIQTNLTTAQRSFTVEQNLGRRGADVGGKSIIIRTALCHYFITGF